MTDVRELTTFAEMETASRLFAAVWPPTDPMSAELMRVAQHVGGYVAGAFDGGALVGATVGLPTADGRLHSHITGVTARGRGAGFALKLHQRGWALERGITVITWTFDPLVRRNAYFNLAKLAARADTYFEDFYGEMPDELNAGDPSDRLLVSWPLKDPAVVRAVEGVPHRPAAPATSFLTAGTDDVEAAAEIAERRHAEIGIGTPENIAALRAADRERARAWRSAQRRLLAGALTAGYVITGFTRDGRYVLRRNA